MIKELQRALDAVNARLWDESDQAARARGWKCERTGMFGLNRRYVNTRYAKEIEAAKERARRGAAEPQLIN